jgi:hypothetical protein
VIIMGVAWYALGAFGKATLQGYERDQVSAAALKKAKEALLAYVAQSAAMTTDALDSRHLNPGRLPCPEALAHPGTANEGKAADLVAGYTCSNIGRLPWKSLGVDLIRDGYGEPLWYAVPLNTWAKTTTATTLTINAGLANALPYDGTANSVVAVIIAPGQPLNTTTQSGAPSGTCAGFATFNQLTAGRNTAPLAAANFVECGNATAANYTTIGTSPWSNDRTISITANEVMDAISGAVANRLQRQVATALQDWYTAQSTAWGLGRSFFPYASTFTTPTANTLCGTLLTNEGVLPSAMTSAGTCNTAWGGGTVVQLSGLFFFSWPCTYTGTQMQCQFLGFNNTALLTILSARVNATASNVVSSFRAPITAANVTISSLNGTAAAVSNFSISLNAGTGVASVSAQIDSSLGIGLWDLYTVTVSNLPDAAVLSDARMTWYLNNGWPRYTYYQISTAANASPGANTCTAAGGGQCLTITDLPSDNGLSNDKRFVLTLLGRAVTGKTQPSALVTDYLESHTAGTTTYIFNPPTTGSSNQYKTVTSAFNDRHAACPFKQTAANIICN